jgi:hypothetical protein
MELTCDVCSYKKPDVNKECLYYVTYRITAVIKVKVDIIDRLTASPKGRAMITNVGTFKTDLIVVPITS